MRFSETTVDGARLIDLDRHEDARGFFARLWCRSEVGLQGLTASVAQVNVTWNPAKGTLRGLHWQEPPHEEAKVVFCARGAIFDVALDLRPESRTYGQWAGITLGADEFRLFYIPEGCAHGYQTLQEDTVVVYQTTEPYAPESERGVRWDDPAFEINWPAHPELTISAKDLTWPDYQFVSSAARGGATCAPGARA
jgi:dTDP-4-dehydrorhamnose 3,5-epimerase